MKIFPNIFFSLIAFLFSILNGIAKTTPPPPTGKSAATMTPPPPPGLPIDQGVVVGIIIAMVYGIYVIYSHQLDKKTSI